MKLEPESMAEAITSGDRLILSRVLTLIENYDPIGIEVLSLLFQRTGRAHLVGITGAPGTGKSTIVNRIASYLRHVPQEGQLKPPEIAIIAVDPSSPFSGGALLGDRIRMRDLSGDPGIFIRSMASRGALGGLAHTTADVAAVLDAAGYDLIMIETVGAGQAEVEIASTAQTTIVIDAPGLGDDIQAIKAGLMEIADIMVVNKADRPGAKKTLKALRNALMLGHPSKLAKLNQASEDGQPEMWLPPVLSAVATRNEGIEEIVAAIQEHRRYLNHSGLNTVRERERRIAQVEYLLRERLAYEFHARHPAKHFDGVIEKVLAREFSPHQAVQSLMQDA